MKTCSSCKIKKSLNQFWVDKNSSDGKTYSCIDCIKSRRNYKYMREYMEEKRKDPKYKKYKREQYRNTDPRKKVFLQARNRAKRKNIQFNLSIEDIIIPEYCPVLKQKFVIGTKDNYEYTHSIDRIDNSKGYIKGNIQIVTKKANSMKNNASPLELVNFAKWVLNNDDIVRAAEIIQTEETAELEDKEPLR